MNTYQKHRRNVNLILLLYFLYALAFSWGIIIILYFQHFELSFLQIGTTFLALTLLILILEIPTGAFADIYGRRKSVILFCLINIFSMIFYVIGLDFWILLLASTLFGIAVPFWSGAGDAMLFESLKKTKREKQFEKYLSRAHVLFIIGSLIGVSTMPLIYEINIRLPAIISLLFAFVIFFTSLFLYEKKINNKKKLKLFESYKLTLSKAVIEFGKHPILPWLLIFVGLIGTLQEIFAEFIVQPIVFENFDLKTYSLIFALATIIQTIIVHYTPKVLELANKSKYLIIVLLLSITLFTITFTENIYLISLCIGILFSVGSIIDIINQSVVNKKIKSNNIRATVLSTFSMFISFLLVIGYPIIGNMLDTMNINYVTQILGGITLLVGIIILIFKKKN